MEGKELQFNQITAHKHALHSFHNLQALHNCRKCLG